MLINSYSYTDRTLEELATQVFKMTIGFLESKEYITEEDALKVLKTHAIMVREPLFFRRYWDKITKKEKDDAKEVGARLFVVKMADGED
jgi:hypothetical protein